MICKTNMKCIFSDVFCRFRAMNFSQLVLSALSQRKDLKNSFLQQEEPVSGNAIGHFTQYKIYEVYITLMCPLCNITEIILIFLFIEKQYRLCVTGEGLTLNPSMYT